MIVNIKPAINYRRLQVVDHKWTKLKSSALYNVPIICTLKHDKEKWS